MRNAVSYGLYQGDAAFPEIDRSERTTVTWHVRVTGEKQALTGTVCQISVNGMVVLFDRQLPANRPTELTLLVPNPDDLYSSSSVQASVTVQECVLSRHRFRHYVQIEALSQEHQKLLATWRQKRT